jgi:hypothetical protein
VKHGLRSCRVGLLPDEGPRTVLVSVFSEAGLSVVVLTKAARQIIGVADVEATVGVFEDVDPETAEWLPRLGSNQRPSD